MESTYGASYFSSRYASDAARETVWAAIVAYLKPFIPPQGTVLDLGAGYCAFINQVQAAQKHALDIFPDFKAHARPDVKTHVGDCSQLTMFASQTIDVVFASNLLEHLDAAAAQRTLEEVRRVLKREGRLILLQPNFRYAFREYFDDYTHVQIFTDIGLADLLRAHGFMIETLQPRFLPFSFKSHLPKWGWLVWLYLRLPWRPCAKQMLLVARPAL